MFWFVTSTSLIGCPQISNGIAGYQLDRPELTQARTCSSRPLFILPLTPPPTEAIKELLPDSQFAESEHGELLLEMDVRLKRFPEHKSFWQLIKDSSKRGDSMEVLANLPTMARAQAAQWLYGVASSVVASGVDEVVGSVGMGDVRKGLGVGARVRAEWKGVDVK